MGIKITERGDYYSTLMRTAMKIGGVVGSTMGAKGRNVIISNDYGAGTPLITKDGLTVARAYDVEDPLENIVVSLVKQAAFNTNRKVGDGTTTCTVLATDMISEGFSHFDGTYPNVTKVVTGMDIAYKRVEKILKDISIQVKDDEAKLREVATVSSNNDPELGGLVSESFGITGAHGLVRIQPSSTGKTYVEADSGMEIKSGLVSHYYIAPDKKEKTINNPKVLITDFKFRSIQDVNRVTPILQELHEGSTVVVIGAELETSALQEALKIHMANNTQMYFISPPNLGMQRQYVLEDLATVLGTKYYRGDEILSDIEFGTCDMLVADTETTRVMGGQFSQEEIDQRVETVHELIKKKEDVEFHEERLAKLLGGVANIYVDAASETMFLSIKSRLEDSINAVKSAWRGGVIAGGGSPLAQLRMNLHEEINLVSEEDSDIGLGMRVVQFSLSAPMSTILNNADIGTYDLEQLAELGYNWGYNVTTGGVVDLYEAGIIDPTEVVLEALKNAVEVAKVILTTQYIIV